MTSGPRDFDRVKDHRDFERERRASLLYEELRTLTLAELERRAGHPGRRNELIAELITVMPYCKACTDATGVFGLPHTCDRARRT